MRATLEKTKLIHHGMTMWKSRTIGLKKLSRWYFHYCHSITRAGPIARGKDSKERRQTVFFAAVDPMNEPQRDELYDVKGPRQVPDGMKWKVHQNAVYWINLQSAQDRGLIFWQKHSNAIIFDNSVPADCLFKKVVNLKTGEILDQKIRLSPRLPPKVFLKCVWQGQHEGQVQQESTGRPLADQVTITPEVGQRFQGVPHEQPQQDEENSQKRYIRRLVHERANIDDKFRQPRTYSSNSITSRFSTFISKLS